MTTALALYSESASKRSAYTRVRISIVAYALSLLLALLCLATHPSRIWTGLTLIAVIGTGTALVTKAACWYALTPTQRALLMGHTPADPTTQESKDI